MKKEFLLKSCVIVFFSFLRLVLPLHLLLYLQLCLFCGVSLTYRMSTPPLRRRGTVPVTCTLTIIGNIKSNLSLCELDLGLSSSFCLPNDFFSSQCRRGGFLSPKSENMLELFSSYARTYEVKFMHNSRITFCARTKKLDSEDSQTNQQQLRSQGYD